MRYDDGVQVCDAQKREIFHQLLPIVLLTRVDEGGLPVEPY